MNLKEQNDKLREALKHLVAVTTPDVNGQIGAVEEHLAALDNANAALSQQDGNEVASPAQDELLSGFCQWYRGKNGCAPYHPRGSEGAEAFAAGAEWQRTRPAQTAPQPGQSGLASAVRAYLDAIDNGSDEYDVKRARSGVRHALSAQGANKI